MIKTFSAVFIHDISYLHVISIHFVSGYMLTIIIFIQYLITAGIIFMSGLKHSPFIDHFYCRYTVNHTVTHTVIVCDGGHRQIIFVRANTLTALMNLLPLRQTQTVIVRELRASHKKVSACRLCRELRVNNSEGRVT